MGRYYWKSKTEANNLKRIDATWLNENSMLSGRNSYTLTWKNNWDSSKIIVGITILPDDKQVRLYYTQAKDDGTEKDIDYTIRLTETPCHFSGKRYWFICPLSKNGVPCNRRIRTLYKVGDYFGCRHCFELTYKSRNENRRSKLYYLFRVLSIRFKLDKKREKMKRI